MDHGSRGLRAPRAVHSLRGVELALVLSCALLPACASRATGAPATPLAGGGVEIRDVRGGGGSLDITSEASVRDTVLSAGRAPIWAALPSVFETLGIETSTVDPGSLVIGNRGTRSTRVEGRRMSGYLDCGSGFGGAYADRYQITLYLMVQLASRADGGTLVRTILDASARPRDVSGNAVHCRSKGTLERRVVELITENLSGD